MSRQNIARLTRTDRDRQTDGKTLTQTGQNEQTNTARLTRRQTETDKKTDRHETDGNTPRQTGQSEQTKHSKANTYWQRQKDKDKQTGKRQTE